MAGQDRHAVARARSAQRIVLLGTGPGDSHTLGLEALAAQLAELGTASRMLGPRISLLVLLAALEASPDAIVVIVSHLMSQRRSTVASLVALAEAEAPTFFAGNAFLMPVARKDVPGSYLGESIGAGAHLIAGHTRSAAAARS